MRRIPVVGAVLGGVIGAAVIVGAIAASAGVQPADDASRPAATATASSVRVVVDAEVDAGVATVAPVTPAPAAAPVVVEPAGSEPTTEQVDVVVEPSPEASDDWFPTLEERETWLEFQQIVRDCMAEAGQDYLYWEWWNSSTSGGFQAMPTDLTGDERAAWELALHGDTGGGADYHWEDAGCWGYAAELKGNTH